jgi:hypothetical protein
MAWLMVLAGLPAIGQVELREEVRPDQTTRVSIELKAEGQFLPAAPPGTAEEKKPKPLALKVEAQLEYVERIVPPMSGSGEGTTRAIRRVVRAASAINGDVRPSAATLRPEVALLVAEPRASGVVVYSAGGPLTRSELELVQGPGDPLTFSGLLPAKPAIVGDHWAVADSAVRALSEYDQISSHTVEATLESLDASVAKFTVQGQIRGSAFGGEGSMACNGSFTFDRKAGRVDRLSLRRAEARRPGPVEDGLDVKSTLIVARIPAEPHADLTDERLARWPLDPGPDHERERLIMVGPESKYSIVHDRDWHRYADDARLVVLKRVERGKAVAQCNLAIGPNAGRGRHQDPDRFRDDIRKGLGTRFGQFLGVGEVEGDPAGGYRYKVGAQGRQGDVGVVWYYYLVASPEGDQLVATFTMAEAEANAFGNRDESLIGSLRWK